DKAAKKMKKWADEKRRYVEFEFEDQVMVKLLPQQFKSLRKVHKGLIQRYEGHFSLIGRVRKVSYRVQLPPKLKIHPVFHVSFLKPYHEDEEDMERGVSKRVPTAVVTSYDREVLAYNELYMKLEKCSFTQDEVEFLGHKIKDGGLMMDDAKIKAIQDWEPPTKVTELRSFIGLVNYYERFIMGYSAIASYLTDLLKKNKAWLCQANKSAPL
nr:hypothetical protein CTI12_AA187700 [Tanacetum cinerariifolium]